VLTSFCRFIYVVGSVLEDLIEAFILTRRSLCMWRFTVSRGESTTVVVFAFMFIRCADCCLFCAVAIAMSVRSTNVYEERALGVYHHPDQDWETETPEPEIKDFHKGHRREVFSKYLAWHMRRQLAFDIWPLALAIWAICCFERGKILDPETSSWFSVFRIIFECTSAYSTIGLSMGTPNNNYSFSGEFGTASKIVVSGFVGVEGGSGDGGEGEGWRRETGGQKDRRKEGQQDRRTEGQKGRRAEGQKDRRTEGQKERRTEGQNDRKYRRTEGAGIDEAQRGPKHD
jgi:hypothetical protein